MIAKRRIQNRDEQIKYKGEFLWSLCEGGYITVRQMNILLSEGATDPSKFEEWCQNGAKTRHLHNESKKQIIRNYEYWKRNEPPPFPIEHPRNKLVLLTPDEQNVIEEYRRSKSRNDSPGT